MSLQYSVTDRNNRLLQTVSDLGSTPVFNIFTGSPPANCAAAATGTQLSSHNGSNPVGSVTGGVLTFSAIANGTGLANGTAGYFRGMNGATCVVQGTVFPTVVQNLSTTATGNNSNVLNLLSVSGLQIGMAASGTGIPVGAVILGISGANVSLSMACPSGVAASTQITFGGDISLNSVNISTGQTVSITGGTIIASGA
jgi:hypothetical protein